MDPNSHVLKEIRAARKDEGPWGLFSVWALFDEQVALRGYFWGTVVAALCALGVSTCGGMLILLIQWIVNGAVE